MFSFATENEFFSNNVRMRVNEGWAEGRSESNCSTKIAKEKSNHIFKITLYIHYINKLIIQRFKILYVVYIKKSY